MKKIFFIATIAAGFWGCTKHDLNDNDTWRYKEATEAQLKFLNAYTAMTPSIAVPANGPTVDFYVNNVKANATAMGYSTIYPNVAGTYAATSASGMVNIKAVLNRPTGGGLPSDTISNGNYLISPGASYSVVLVDTFPNATPLSPILMVVGESVTQPTTYARFRARFLNLCAVATDTLEIFSTYYNQVVCPAQVFKNLSDWIELTVPIPSPTTADSWQLRRKGTTTSLISVSFTPGVSRSYTFIARGNGSTARPRTFGFYTSQ